MNKCSTRFYVGMDVSEKSIEILVLPRDNDVGRPSLTAFGDSVKEAGGDGKFCALSHRRTKRQPLIEISMVAQDFQSAGSF